MLATVTIATEDFTPSSLDLDAEGWFNVVARPMVEGTFDEPMEKSAHALRVAMSSTRKMSILFAVLTDAVGGKKVRLSAEGIGYGSDYPENGEGQEMFESEELLRSFIFNPNSSFTVVSR